MGQNGPKMPQNGPNLGENVRKHFCIQHITTYHCLPLRLTTYSLIQEKCHIVFCNVKWGDSGHFLRFLSHRSPGNCLEIKMLFFFFTLHLSAMLNFLIHFGKHARLCTLVPWWRQIDIFAGGVTSDKIDSNSTSPLNVWAQMPLFWGV